MEIRSAKKEDLAGILALYAQLNPGESVLEASTAIDIWQEILTSKYSRHFVASDGQHIVSTCYLTVV